MRKTCLGDGSVKVFGTTWLVDNQVLKALLFARDGERRRIIVVRGFKPYFYVPGDETVDIYGRGVKRIEVSLPSMVPRLRKQYDYTCEADVPYVERLLIDRGIKTYFQAPGESVDYRELLPGPDTGERPRIVYYDIEVVSPPEIMPSPSNPKYPVCTIQFSDSYTGNVYILFYHPLADPHDTQYYAEMLERLSRNKPHSVKPHVFIYNDERILLQGFAMLLDVIDPDIITGWNSDFFDLPYLVRRMRMLGIDPGMLSPVRRVSDNGRFIRISGRATPDMLEAYRKWHKTRGERDTYDLKYVLRDEVKWSYEDFGDRIKELWDDPHRWITLMDYAYNDAIALMILDEKLGLFEFYETVREITGARLGTIENMVFIEALLYRIRNEPLPTKKHDDQVVKKRIKGAAVLDPLPGLHENVGVFDAKSLYPSLIMRYNISPEIARRCNYDLKCMEQQPDGLMKRVVKYFQVEREKLRSKRRELESAGLMDSEEYKIVSMRETAMKFLAASTYGVMANERFVLYDEKTAALITRLGRETILGIKKYVESQYGLKVLYGDTDSVFISLGAGDMEDVVAKGRELQESINKYLEQLHGGGVIVKFEKLYSKIFFKQKRRGEPTKKRYAGLLIWKEGAWMEKIDIKGFEPKRSDAARITRDAMREFFEKLLKNGKSAAFSVVKKYYDEFRELANEYGLGYIGIPKGVSMNRVYKTENVWLRGMKWAAKNLGWRFREDRKPLLIYVRRIGRRDVESTDVICLPEPDAELPDWIEVDWEKQRQKTLVSKFEDIFRSLGYDVRALKSQRTLESWFRR